MWINFIDNRFNASKLGGVKKVEPPEWEVKRVCNKVLGLRGGGVCGH